MSSTLIIIIAIVAFVILLSAALSVATFSDEKFMQEYEKIADVPCYSGITILDFVHALNYNIFGGRLKIRSVEQDTNNFYAPHSKTVALSKRTLSSDTLASFAIVAHEMGHALQDKEGSKLTRLNFLRRFGSLLGFLFLPTIIAGIVMLFLGEDLRFISYILFGVAGGIFLLAVIIKARTISIEKDASDKGLKFLEGVMSNDELEKCRQLLKAARLTYWADLLRLLLSWTMLTRKMKMFR